MSPVLPQKPVTTGSNEERSTTVIAVATAFTALVAVTACLRLTAKIKSKIGPTLDDYFITFTTVINIVANSFDIKACASGFGRHAYTLSFEDEIEAIKFAQLAVGLAGIAYWAAKISICLFILQVIRNAGHKKLHACVYALMGIVTISSFIALLIWGIQATPFPKAWDPRIHGTTRNPQLLLDAVYFNYTINIFVNFLYALSPLYLLWRSKMNLRKKMTVFALMGSASLIIVISALNIAYAHEFLDRTDPTWALVNEYICDIVERNFTVIIANLPGVWMLASRLREQYEFSQDQSPAQQIGTRPLDNREIKVTATQPPMNIIHKKEGGGCKNVWRWVRERNQSDEDNYPLRGISAEGVESLAGHSGNISVQTEIFISEESQDDVAVSNILNVGL